VTVLSDSLRERIGKWKICPLFKGGQMVGARLAEAFVIKTTILLGISRATFSKVMSAYINNGKTIERRETVDENQH
jgi:hypothetical protein